MSVLCCRIPNFLITLACRQTPAWANRPLALLGPDERVWAASPLALRAGIQVQMCPQEAQIACPEVLLRPLDLATGQAEQNAWLAQLAEWSLPVELQSWGMAYVDLHAVAKTAPMIQPLVAELGGRLRAVFGESLQPALGWDSGKFTAQAAAAQTAPGHMRLVDKSNEVRFLAPLPVTLLPFPRPHLQQLSWLGIRTLGQFAQLPPAAVGQRFGAAGKLAQRWAQGHDDRPVRATRRDICAPVEIALDPPSGLLQPVVEAILGSLRPALARRVERLEGIRRLRVTLSFVTGGERACELTFVEPAGQPGRVHAALVQQLCALRWPAEVQAVQWLIMETGELMAPQLTLFAEAPTRLAPLAGIAQKLSSRYGPLLFQAQVHEAHHPLPERRSRFYAIHEV